MVGFILHWCEQMRLLEDMSPVEDHLRDGIEKQMLEAAVENILKLSSVKDIDTNMAAKGGKLTTYVQYKDTLIATATRRDERLKPASVRAKRVVQAAETEYGFSGGDWFNQGHLDAGDNFFSSSDNEPTLIHQLAQRTTTNKGANQFWLPREIWDMLSPDVQAEIKEWNKTKAFQSRPKAQSRVANIHDVMGYTEEVDVSTGDDRDEYVTEDVVIDES